MWRSRGFKALNNTTAALSCSCLLQTNKHHHQAGRTLFIRDRGIGMTQVGVPGVVWCLTQGLGLS
jgi:hypothetical protein